MRGFSWKEFLNRHLRGRRFRASGSMPGITHAATYRRPGDSLVMSSIVECVSSARLVSGVSTECVNFDGVFVSNRLWGRRPGGIGEMWNVLEL